MTEFEAEVISASGTNIRIRNADGGEIDRECTENVGKFAKPGKATISEKDGVITFVKTAGSTFKPASKYTPKLPRKTDREEFRGSAENAVRDNINSAMKVASIVGIECSPSDLVQIADMIGRTMTAIMLDSK